MCSVLSRGHWSTECGRDARAPSSMSSTRFVDAGTQRPYNRCAQTLIGGRCAMAVVGSGEYRYERVPVWPNMPRYWSFGAASDGAVNGRDEVHIFSRGGPSPYDMGHGRQLHIVLGRGHVLRQPARHLHRPQRERVAGGPGLPHSHGVLPRGRAAEDARQQAGAVAVVPGRAVQHAVGPGHRAQRGDLRVRRLRRTPGPQVQRGRRPAAVLGQGGRRSRASSPTSTTSASTAGAGFSSATGRTTASSSSTTRAASWRSGPTCLRRGTSGSATTWPTS